MSAFTGPKKSIVNLVSYYTSYSRKTIANSYTYRWFSTNGTNPITKEGFDAFFNVQPVDSGIDKNRNIDWTSVSIRPPYIIPTTAFAWEAKCWLKIDTAGFYVFNTGSDDGNELQINDVVVTSFYGGRGVPNPGEMSESIYLNTGYHKFQYRMQQGAGGAGARVRWITPENPNLIVIPYSNFHTGNDTFVLPDLIGSNHGIPWDGVEFVENFTGGLGPRLNGSNYVSLVNFIDPTLPYSIIQWVKATTPLEDTTNSNSRKTPLTGMGPVWNPGYWLTARVFRVHCQTEYRDITINLVNDTSWHQIGQIFNGVNCFHIFDGRVYSGTRHSYNPPVPTDILLGSETTSPTSRNWVGDLGSLSIYNNSISEEDVWNNYISFKKRYNYGQ